MIKKFLCPLLVLVAVCCLNSCKCSRVVETYVTLDESQLPQAQVLKANYISLPVLTNIEYMVYNQGKLLLQNIRKDSILMLLDTERFELLRHWGRIGRGPGEYSDFVKWCVTSDGNFAFYDKTFRRIGVMNPEQYDTISCRYVEGICDDLPQRIVMNSTQKPFRMIYTKFDARQRNVMSWSEGSEPRSIYNFPDLNELSSMAKIGFLCANLDQNRVIHAYAQLRRFDIMDTLGNMVRSVSINPSNNIQPPGDEYSADNYTYYFDAWAGSDTFFLYYVGHTGRMLKENLFRPTYIEEYDYDGNPIARYEIDQFSRSVRSVDNNRFVCMTVGNEEFPLVVYQ